jgi:hypothetical protein
MQVRSRELVKAAMCGVRASAALRAGVQGVEGFRVAVAAAGVVEALAGAAAALVGAAGAAGAAEAAGAGVDEADAFFIYLLSLAKRALRRKDRCCEVPEILLISHRPGTGAL